MTATPTAQHRDDQVVAGPESGRAYSGARRRLAGARDAEGGPTAHWRSVPLLGPLRERRVISGDVDQGREMTVAVAEFEGLNLAGARVHRIADRVGSDLGEGCVAVLLPDLVERLEARR